MLKHPLRKVVAHRMRQRRMWFRNISNRGGVLVLTLECGHIAVRKASHGIPVRARCNDCPSTG